MVTKRARLWLSRGLAITVFLVTGGLFAATWYYSGEIESALFAPRPDEPQGDVVLLQVTADSVSVAADDRTTRPGRWGLRLPAGSVVVGDLIGSDQGVATRAVVTAEGSISSGERGVWDRSTYPTPEDRGIDHREVLLDGPLGSLPAWVTDADSGAWAIFVHGGDSDRREALRALPAAIEAGYSTITLAYRNDEEAPASTSGRHGFGRNEWSDVHAAVEFALAADATDVVLVGLGTGGSIVEVFMTHSPLAGRIDGIVLDAPVLDVGALVDRIAREDKVPGFIVAWSRAMASFRFGIEWSALDHLRAVGDITIPVLLFHGSDDEYAPLAVSREYAEALGDLATLVVVEGAGHGEAWNLDPAAYEAVLTAFLEEIAEPQEAGG